MPKSVSRNGLNTPSADISIDLHDANADVHTLFDDEHVHSTLEIIRQAVGRPRAVVVVSKPGMRSNGDEKD